jgi:hypothetical protein
MSQRKRISRTERRGLLRKLGALTVACLALVDGVTPDEIVAVVRLADDFILALRRAVVTVEPVEADAEPQDGY